LGSEVRFGVRFGTILGPFLGPKGGHIWGRFWVLGTGISQVLGSKRTPRSDPKRGPKGGPKRGQKGSKRGHLGPLGPPGVWGSRGPIWGLRSDLATVYVHMCICPNTLLKYVCIEQYDKVESEIRRQG
jgi:hypothetical protein